MPLTPLRRARLDSDQTLFAMAQVAGFSTGRLSMIERGLIEPSPDEWRRLADALRVPVTELTGRPEPLEAA